MVFHRCRLCSDGPPEKRTMPARKKNLVTESTPQVLRSSKRVAKLAEKSKDKELNLSQKCQAKPVKKVIGGKRNVSLVVPSPQIESRKRKIENPTTSKDKRLKLFKKDQVEPVVNTYCWLCHKLGQDQMCTCKRVYHSECLVKASKEFKENKCPECQSKSVDGTELTRPFSEGLKVYLESVSMFVVDKYKNEILSWPQTSDCNQIVPSTDFKTLLKKVQDDAYSMTSEFYADVKWIYHNCFIVYGEHSQQAKALRKIIKDFKDELLDMEACPECYYHFYCKTSAFTNNSDSAGSEEFKNSNENNFVRLCNPPHDIVWAKVAGYSHFPAKCLKVVNGKAHVRFFGKHEKSDIPINTIFHISKTHPLHSYKDIYNTEKRNSLGYMYAKRELLEYITLYEKSVGKFEFFGFRVFYEPENDNPKTGKGPRNQKPVTHKNKNLLELSSRANSAALEPPVSATTIVPAERSETNLSNPSTNDISVNMTFDVDNSIEAEDCADDSYSSSSNVRMPTVLTERRSCIKEIENSPNQAIPNEHYPFLYEVSNTSSGSISPSSSKSSLYVSSDSAASSNDIQIKEEVSKFMQADRFPLESNNETTSNFIQIIENALNVQSNFRTEEGILASDSPSTSILRNYVSRVNSGKTFSTTATVPELCSIKEENSYLTISTSQPETQNNRETAGNPVTVKQGLPEIEIVSHPLNNEIAVIDLTKDDAGDSSPMSLSSLLSENPNMRNLFQHAHNAVETLLTRLCVETCKQQKTEPGLLCKALNKKLNETEKKFHEETDNLRDEIKRLQMSLEAEKKKNMEP